MQILNFIKSYYLHISIVVIGFILRVVNIGFPKKFIMDEAYYVPDGYSIFKNGYEIQWVEKYTSEWADKILSVFSSSPDQFYSDNYYSTHPPLGKILIGLGMYPFSNDNSIGWRISALIFGTLVIVATMLLAQQIFKNKYITLMSGFFIAIDGAMISMSRSGMLDIFLTFFVVTGFIFLAKFIEKQEIKNLLFMSVFFGFATSVKWSGIYFFAGACLLLFVTLIIQKQYIKSIFYSFIAFTIMLLSYVLTWISWFISYSSHEENIFLKFVSHHIETLNVASGISTLHNYKTNAYEWIFISRPTALIVDGDAEKFSHIYAMPNLFFWFFSLIALIIFNIFLFKKQFHKEAWILNIGVIAGWLPWFFVGERTIFNFYVVSFMPYLYIILATVIIIIIKTKTKSFYRIAIMCTIGCGVIFSVLTYPTDVGIEISRDNSIFKNYPAMWINLQQANGLYDKSQAPTPTIAHQPNQELINGE